MCTTACYTPERTLILLNLFAQFSADNTAGIWIAAIGVIGLAITSLTGIALAVLNRKASSAENTKTQADVQQIHVMVNNERTAMKTELARLQERVIALEKERSAKDSAAAATAGTTAASAAALLEKAVVTAAALLATSARREEVRGEGPGAAAPLAAALSANTSATAANTAALDNPPREN